MLTEEIAHIHVDADSLDAAFSCAATSAETLNAVDPVELGDAFRNSDTVAGFMERHNMELIPVAFGFRLGVEYALHLQEEK